ncbi:hypothetical protein ACFQX6_66995 [Streptosporangium lutulentum]
MVERSAIVDTAHQVGEEVRSSRGERVPDVDIGRRSGQGRWGSNRPVGHRRRKWNIGGGLARKIRGTIGGRGGYDSFLFVLGGTITVQFDVLAVSAVGRVGVISTLGKG